MLFFKNQTLFFSKMKKYFSSGFSFSVLVCTSSIQKVHLEHPQRLQSDTKQWSIMCIFKKIHNFKHKKPRIDPNQRSCCYFGPHLISNSELPNICTIVIKVGRFVTLRFGYFLYIGSKANNLQLWICRQPISLESSLWKRDIIISHL